MQQKFILHIAFPEDERLKGLNLYNWQTKLKHVTEPVVNILAPLSIKTRNALYEQLIALTTEPVVAVLYPQPFKSYMMMCNNASNDMKIQQNYSNMQPSVQAVDCDKIQLADHSVSLFDAVLADRSICNLSFIYRVPF